MSDENNKNGSGFKVKDNRMFDEEGNPREGVDKPEKEPVKNAAKDTDKNNDKDSINEKCPRELPPIDFTTFVSSLATAALIALGEVALDNNAPQPDIQAARQHIDILDLLAEKTKGNLTPEEDTFLKRILSDLKLKYVQKCSQTTG